MTAAQDLLAELRQLRTATLLIHWKEASLRSGWRFEDDWKVPETIQLVSTYIRRVPMGHAAKDLGSARALQGIGFSETFADLRAFFDAAGALPDPSAQQELTEGWVATTEPAAEGTIAYVVPREHLERAPSHADAMILYGKEGRSPDLQREPLKAR